MDDIANCCIKVGILRALAIGYCEADDPWLYKVYTLEKVLRMKKDPATQVEFLEEVMKVGLIISCGDCTRRLMCRHPISAPG
jgi:hypothetical protein